MHEILLRPTVRGFFKLTAIRPDGRERPLTGWFPNLITDVGLNRIGTGSYLTACHVGSNNTTPTVADTILAGFVAGTTTIQAESYGAQTTAPYYGWKTRTYRFAQGVATGNLAEVGIATGKTNGGATIMFSRALILDELGAPTTVTVLADEVLDVTYQLRLYPPLTDVVQTGVTILGSGTHDITTRARAVTSNSWGLYLGNTASFDPSGGSSIIAYNGAIGTITGSPSGAADSVSAYNVAYGNNNLYRDGGGTWGLNNGNLAGGIRSVVFSTSLGLYQTEFSPVLNKINSKTLNLLFRIAWARNV